MATSLAPGQTVYVDDVPCTVVNTGPKLTVVRVNGRSITVPTGDCKIKR